MFNLCLFLLIFPPCIHLAQSTLQPFVGVAVRSPPNHLTPRLKKPWFFSLSLQAKSFSPNYPGGPPLNLLHFIHVFLVSGSPKLSTISQKITICDTGFKKGCSCQENQAPKYLGNKVAKSTCDKCGFFSACMLRFRTIVFLSF